MTKKKDHDFNITAYNVVQQATSEDEPTQDNAEVELVDGKNPYAVHLGSLGGKARSEKLTPEQRKEIAKKAARARWQKNQSPNSQISAPE